MNIKKRIGIWISDYEDTSLLKETGIKNVKNYLLDEAKEIFDKIAKEEKWAKKHTI